MAEGDRLYGIDPARLDDPETLVEFTETRDGTLAVTNCHGYGEHAPPGDEPCPSCRRCRICHDKPIHTRGRCTACYRYLNRYDRERPAALIIEHLWSTPPARGA